MSHSVKAAGREKIELRRRQGPLKPGQGLPVSRFIATLGRPTWLSFRADTKPKRTHADAGPKAVIVSHGHTTMH